MTQWWWASEDDDPVGPFPTRTAARDDASAAPTLRRDRYAPGDYAYVCGYPGEDNRECFYVFRAGTAIHRRLVLGKD